MAKLSKLTILRAGDSTVKCSLLSWGVLMEIHIYRAVGVQLSISSNTRYHRRTCFLRFTDQLSRLESSSLQNHLKPQRHPPSAKLSSSSSPASPQSQPQIVASSSRYLLPKTHNPTQRLVHDSSNSGVGPSPVAVTPSRLSRCTLHLAK